MSNPIITKRPDGEYITYQIGETVETRWFPNDEDAPAVPVGRTVISTRYIHQEHIAQFESQMQRITKNP